MKEAYLSFVVSGEISKERYVSPEALISRHRRKAVTSSLSCSPERIVAVLVFRVGGARAWVGKYVQQCAWTACCILKTTCCSLSEIFSLSRNDTARLDIVPYRWRTVFQARNDVMHPFHSTSLARMLKLHILWRQKIGSLDLASLRIRHQVKICFDQR